jgi:hypothetical protein
MSIVDKLRENTVIKKIKERFFYKIKVENKRVKCPVCERSCGVGSIVINSGMAEWLCKLVAEYEETQDWVHVDVMVPKTSKAGKSSSSGTTMANMWGLAVQMPNDKDPTKNKLGYWKPTQKGIDFAMSRITLPRGVRHYYKEVLGYTEEHISIKEVDGFDYRTVRDFTVYESSRKKTKKS